jgi:hypothetical protein
MTENEKKEWLKSRISKRFKSIININLDDFTNEFKTKIKDFTNHRLINEMEEIFETFCGEKTLNKDDLLLILMWSDIDSELVYTSLIRWEKNPTKHMTDRYNIVWYK